MNVIDAAAEIGLSVNDPEVTGTVDEAKVLEVLAGLAAGDPDNADLYTGAARSVQSARSAGVEAFPEDQRLIRRNDAATIQLRYRAEMVAILTDLTIDIGLRRHRSLADASV